MIRPIINGGGGAAPAPAPRQDEDHSDEEDERIVRRPRRVVDADDERGGAANALSGVHPALVGLIQNLPAVGAALGPKRRAALIDAFKSTINFIYPEEEE